MTMMEAIDARQSRRRYMDAAMTQQDIGRLNALIGQYREQAGVKMQLVIDNGNAFAGFRKSYGMFSGVRNYVVLVENKNDLHSLEKLGYYGELLVLGATLLGLGTCWVGGSFDRKDCPFEPEDGEEIVCVIPIGSVEPGLSGREKLIHKFTHRKKKSIEEFYTADTVPPDWFMEGVLAAQKAPSAVNRQPVKFFYKDHSVTAMVDNTDKQLMMVDFGIAKLHFELGAGGGNWVYGNNGAFKKEND